MLNEVEELPIKPNSKNTFLVAASFGNQMGYHDGGRHSFTVNFETGEADNPPRKNRRIFIVAAHGIMMALAWMLFTPVVVAASLLRNLLPPGGKLWFQMHMLLKTMSSCLTITAFIMIVAMAFRQDPGHKPTENTHFITGWVIAFAVTAQEVAGALRPHDPCSNVKTNLNAKDSQDGVSVTLGTKETDSRTSVRRVWEYSHRTFGMGLVATAPWQLRLLEVRFGAKSYIKLYIISFFGSVRGVETVESSPKSEIDA